MKENIVTNFEDEIIEFSIAGRVHVRSEEGHVDIGASLESSYYVSIYHRPNYTYQMGRSSNEVIMYPLSISGFNHDFRKK